VAEVKVKVEVEVARAPIGRRPIIDCLRRRRLDLAARLVALHANQGEPSVSEANKEKNNKRSKRSTTKRPAQCALLGRREDCGWWASHSLPQIVCRRLSAAHCSSGDCLQAVGRPSGLMVSLGRRIWAARWLAHGQKSAQTAPLFSKAALLHHFATSKPATRCRQLKWPNSEHSLQLETVCNSPHTVSNWAPQLHNGAPILRPIEPNGANKS